MYGPQNAQDFIRALKASSDPPQPSGPQKIDIARKAWDKPSLYVPNKAEVIVDWLLSRLLKDKSRERSENPVCDSRYWRLLSDILINSNLVKDAHNSRTLRAWLLPLLNRIPIAPIFLSYLSILSNGGYIDVDQYKLVFRCISVLWPLAVPKFNPETLLEAFGAVLQLSVSSALSDPSCGQLQISDDSRALSAIVSSYRTSLTSMTAKRKQIYAIFLKKHFSYWLRAISWCCVGERESSFPVVDIYDAGIETIFGLDIIRQGPDHRHDVVLTEALEATLKEHPGVVLWSLPHLFGSYVQTIKRHKNTLFNQGSNQPPGHTTEPFQRLTMTFYTACDSLTGMVADNDNLSWGCRVLLLEVVERETLLNQKDEDAKAILRRDVDSAVAVLATIPGGDHAQHTDNAVKTLATLARIDHDLISASFAVVFPRLAAAPFEVSSALLYITLLLEYDSKTRNLPSFILHISDAFSVHHLERIPGGPVGAYKVVSAGPLTSLPFLDELSRAVHNFLTPGQVLDTIRDVSRSLQDAYERFVEREAKHSADRGDGPRKKRKKDAPHPEDRSELEYHAVAFALVARVLAVVLRSLPLHMVTEDVRSEAEQQLICEVHSAVVYRAIEEGLGAKERRGSRAWQLVVTWGLALHYVLARSSGTQLPLRLPLGEDLALIMLACVSAENTMPEMVVEMLRTLLHQCSLGALDPEAVISSVLEYLDANLVSANTVWSGKAHCLDTHAAGAVAVLHLIADRWLPYIDEWTTPAQSERLAMILVNVRRERSQQSSSLLGMSAHSVVSRLLHNAQFWELIKLRDAFLAQLHEQTAPLSQIEFSSLLSKLPASSPRVKVGDIVKTAAVYDVLIVMPPEYLPRPMHVEYVKRGFAADVAVLLTLRHAKKAQVSEHHLVVIREVLHRSITHLGTVEFDGAKDYLEYLLEHTSLSGDSSAGILVSTTKQLIDTYQGFLVLQTKQGDNEMITNIIRRYAKSYSIDSPTLAREASLLLVDSLVKFTSSTALSADCVESLRQMYARMADYTIPRLEQRSWTSLDSGVLDIWSRLRILGRWLNIDDDQIPTIGRQLSQTLLACAGEGGDPVLAQIAMSILLGELQGSGNESADHREHIEGVMVSYLILSRGCNRNALAGLESRLAGACRTLSTDTYTMLWDLVHDSLPLQRGLPSQDVTSLIRFSAITLCDAPEGTSKFNQGNTTKCLNLFANDERFTTFPPLRSEVLNFLVRQCNDRPASLRAVDLTSLWSLLRAILTGSSEHEQTTDASVFHSIVSVLGALVRLRRDLVLTSLPHLGFVLRQLIASLAGLRPHLGGKQRRLVLDRLPCWVSGAHPPAAAEGAALARLLTTLTTKTLVRGHADAAAQKPESLVRSFSKHAAYVLAAYVEVVNDPLCVVAVGVRRELQPGLFALCEMLGEHNRDAMMVAALDAGGKATMKMLWKEYEKQRYVGKG